MPSHIARITEAPIDLAALIAQTETPEAGALVVFAGTVRAHNDGRAVTSIDYSCYRPLAERSLADIEQDTLERHDVLRCAIRHRIGPMRIGDTSVLVVVRAAHRGDAFQAGRYAIDTVKHVVPIWKYETYADGSHVYVQGCPLHHDHVATEHP